MAARNLFLSVLCLAFVVISSEQSPPADALNQLLPKSHNFLIDSSDAPGSIPSNSSTTVNSESERLLYEDTFSSETHKKSILEWLDHGLTGEPNYVPNLIRKSYRSPPNRHGDRPKRQRSRKPRRSDRPRRGKGRPRKRRRRWAHKGKARPRRAPGKLRDKKARKGRSRRRKTRPGKTKPLKGRGKSRKRNASPSQYGKLPLRPKNRRPSKSKGGKAHPRRPGKGKPYRRHRRRGRSRGRHPRNQRFRPRWFIPWRWHPRRRQRRRWRLNTNPHRRRWNRFRFRHPHRRGPLIVPLPLPKKAPIPRTPKKSSSSPTARPTLPPDLRGAPIPLPAQGGNGKKEEAFTLISEGEGHAFAHAKSHRKPVATSASSNGNHDKQTHGNKIPVPHTTKRPIASSPPGPTLPPGMRGAPMPPPSHDRSVHQKSSYTFASEGEGHAFAHAASYGKPAVSSASSNAHRKRGNFRLPWLWKQQKDEDSILVTGQSISLVDSQPLQSLLHRRESKPFFIKRSRKKRKLSSIGSIQKRISFDGKSKVNDGDVSSIGMTPFSHERPRNESSIPIQVRIPSPQDLLSKAKKSLCKKVRRPCGRVCKRVSQARKNCKRVVFVPKICKRVKHTTVPCGGKHVRMCKVKKRIPRVCKRRVVIKKQCPRFNNVRRCVPFMSKFCRRNPYCQNLARRPCEKEWKTSACPTPPSKPCKECKKRMILKQCSRVIRRKIPVPCAQRPVQPQQPTSQFGLPPLPQLPEPPRPPPLGATPNTQFVPSEAAGRGPGPLPPRSPPNIQFIPRPPPSTGFAPPGPPRHRPPRPHSRPPRRIPSREPPQRGGTSSSQFAPPPRPFFPRQRPPRPLRRIPPRQPSQRGGSSSSQFARPPQPFSPRQRPPRLPPRTTAKPRTPGTSSSSPSAPPSRPPPLPSNPIFHNPSTIFVAPPKPTPCPCASLPPPFQKSKVFQARRAALASPAPSKSPSPSPSNSPVKVSFQSYANANAVNAGVDSRYEDPSTTYGVSTTTLMADAVTFKDTGSFASSVRCFASFFEDAFCKGAPVQCHLFHQLFDAEVCTANVCRECKKIRHMAASRKLKRYCAKFVKTSCINVNVSLRVPDRKKSSDISESLLLPQVGHLGNKQCFKTVQKVVKLPCNRALPRNERCVKGCRMKVCRNRRKPTKKQFCRNNLPKRCRAFFARCRQGRQTKKCRFVRKKVGTRPCNTSKMQKYQCFKNRIERKPCRRQKAKVKRCARSVTQKFVCGKLKKKVKVACRKPRITRKCHKKFCNIKICRKV